MDAVLSACLRRRRITRSRLYLRRSGADLPRAIARPACAQAPPQMNNTLRKLARDQRAFTLMELLVALVILGVLAAIAIPSYLSFKGKAEGAAAQANVREILPAVES